MSTATQEEDLLIIQDENDSSDESLNFNIDFEDEKKSPETVIEDIWDSTTDDSNQEETFEIELEDDTTTTEKQEEDTVDVQEQEVLEDSQAKDNTDEDFEISLDDESTQEDIIVPENEQWDLSENSLLTDEGSLNIIESENDSIIQDTIEQDTSKVEDLNDILAWTISKLTSRKKSIQDDTSSKQSKVEDLKEEIEKLENQVSEIEAQITALWLESDKIDSNISQLEDMKLDPVKEHNAKRVTKK